MMLVAAPLAVTAVEAPYNRPSGPDTSGEFDALVAMPAPGTAPRIVTAPVAGITTVDGASVGRAAGARQAVQEPVGGQDWRGRPPRRHVGERMEAR